MAIMMNCAVDWTLDIFAEDMQSVKALPLKKGVHSAANLTDGQKFCQYIKTQAKFFAEEHSDNGVYMKDFHTYVGDAFAETLGDYLFSDWYKDTYNQRPHFNKKYIAMLCGLPVFYETGFCDGGYRQSMQDDISRAKEVRRQLMEMAE